MNEAASRHRGVRSPHRDDLGRASCGESAGLLGFDLRELRVLPALRGLHLSRRSLHQRELRVLDR